MRLLALESASAAASVAVWEDGAVKAEMTLCDGRTHSEKLLPLVEAALGALPLEVSDMDAVAVSVGPGSFTGIRIGVATANALAFAAGIPVIEVMTLEALACASSYPQTLALLDARNGRAYAALYKNAALVWGPDALPFGEIAARIPDGTVAVGDVLKENAPELSRCVFIHACCAYPRAGLVAQIAARKLEAGETRAAAKPMYLLKPQAQRQLEAQTLAQGLACRPMRRDDIQAIAMLEKRIFASPWSENALLSELLNPRARYVVLERGGEIIAYAGCWLVYEEAHVNNVAVAPKYHRRGLGERIMRELARVVFSEGGTSMTLEVRASNGAAQSLYAKLGFTQRGRRKKYYSDNQEDALVMWLDDISSIAGQTV